MKKRNPLIQYKVELSTLFDASFCFSFEVHLEQENYSWEFSENSEMLKNAVLFAGMYISIGILLKLLTWSIDFFFCGYITFEEVE